METKFVWNLNNSVRFAVARNVLSTACWVENEADDITSFRAIAQVFANKTATILQVNVTIMHPAYVVPPNLTSDLQRKLINQFHTFAGLCSVFASNVDEMETRSTMNEAAVDYVESIYDDIVLLSDTCAKDIKLYLLQIGAKIDLGSINIIWTNRSLGTTFSKNWVCFSVLMPYLFGTPEGLYMFSVMHGRTKHTCIEWLTSICAFPTFGLSP